MAEHSIFQIILMAYVFSFRKLKGNSSIFKLGPYVYIVFLEENNRRGYVVAVVASSKTFESMNHIDNI